MFLQSLFFFPVIPFALYFRKVPTVGDEFDQDDGALL